MKVCGSERVDERSRGLAPDGAGPGRELSLKAKVGTVGEGWSPGSLPFHSGWIGPC